MVTLDELRAAVATRGSRRLRAGPANDPDSLAILQFTSGSTADPKGVMLPHRCVTANIDAIDAALGLDYDLDRASSWLPLYHDMGLIGMLMIPMTTGTDLVLAGPQDFLAAPSRWAQWISDFHCSITAGPNFSYALSARAMRRGGDLDLSQWRRRAERRRADRAERGRGLARRGCAARPPSRHRVLRLRHGRVHRRRSRSRSPARA